jgi:transposase InsO family protein
LILETVQRAEQRIGQPVHEILRQLTLPSATYYRWQGRQREDDLADQVAGSRPRAPLPTPNEVAAARQFALAHPKTRIAHPESNGRLERLHRTHREEGLTEEVLVAYHQAPEAMTNWSDYYNYRRPHTALKYLCPADY